MNALRKNLETNDPWLSVPQAAAELGLSKYLVLSAVAAGELSAGRAAGRTVISRESVARLKEQRAVQV
jgi:hypothetical protein